MATGDIKILDKLYINQNSICLALSYLGLKFSEDECLDRMCWLLLIFSLISVICSVCIYTVEYGYKKWYKAQEYELNYKRKKDSKCINEKESSVICPCNLLKKGNVGK